MTQITGTRTESGITSFFSILITLQECEITLDKSTYHASSNDLIFSRQNLIFSSTSPLIVFHIQEEFFDNLFDSQISDCRILYDFLNAQDADKEHLYFSNIGDDAKMALALIVQEYNRTDAYHEKLMRLLLVGLFSYLDRNHSDTLLVPRSTMIQNHVFGKIMKYIGENYRDVTLEQTAKQFGYNPDYLSYRFKKITGMSFSKKVQSMRMEEAKHLLLSTDMTIQEIAEANGYHDRSHFSRNFREYTGFSPKEYRKRYR